MLQNTPCKERINVVCHGTILFLIAQDGSIELVLPDVGVQWDHRWQAGSWSRGGLASLEADQEYELRGVICGNGQQRFDPKLDVVFSSSVCAAPSVTGLKRPRRLRFPAPAGIQGCNLVDVIPADTFFHPDDARVKELHQLALLHVLTYECDNIDAVSLVNVRNQGVFNWVPRAEPNVTPRVANLHIFAEPSDFSHVSSAKSEAPFNVLIDTAGACAQNLKMIEKNNHGSFDVLPGPPIPGLPESQKLPLIQFLKIQTSGALHNVLRPINCSPLVVQPQPAQIGTDHAVDSKKSEHAENKAFATMRNNAEPKVLASPKVALIHWGSQHPDALVDETVKQMLRLSFITSALEEYGVSAPKLFGAYAYPSGSTTNLQDVATLPATTRDSDFANGLKHLIEAGAVPDPRQQADLLFLIVGTQGAVSTDPGVLGGHNYFYLDAEHRFPVHYAWALKGDPDKTAASMNMFTRTLSHELLEACTDPEPPLGYNFDGAEICDISMGLHGFIDGIDVSGYFSVKYGIHKKPSSESIEGGSKAALILANACNVRGRHVIENDQFSLKTSRPAQ